MANRYRYRTAGFCFWLIFILTVPVSFFSWGQIPSAGPGHGTTKPEAFTFLNQVLDQYAHPASYHLELVEESQTNGAFLRSWAKWRQVSISGPGNQYHFQYHGSNGRGVQISDGKTEWIYYPPFLQFTQRPAPSGGPGKTLTGKAPGLSSLSAAPFAATNIYKMDKLIRTAAYAPDQTIEIGRKSIACTVVKTEGEFPGKEPAVGARMTFWIDKQTGLIRKLSQRSEGALSAIEPDEQFVREAETIFLVAELNVTSFPEGIFTFDPPVAASLVKEFDQPGNAAFIGKPAPALSFKTADGKEVSLQSFQGKPVLLDFWATWCGPCLKSLPALEKLYRDTRDKGVVIISVDEEENEDAHKASDFWAAHQEPWPNFHGTSEIIGKFPDHGIPYFVLIEASGQIVFSEAGLDETKLRAALDSLPASGVR